MSDLRNTPLLENLKKKMNTGVIPRVDPIAQYRIQDVTVNSFFAIGRFESKGHILDYQLHLMLLEKVGVMNYNISITDETTGEFYSDDQIYPFDVCTFEIEGEGEDARQIIKVPGGCMIGNAQQAHWEGIMPHGKVVVDLTGYGYAVYNAGSGIFNSCMKDEVFRQYSLPTMRTTGVLTIGDVDYPVEGISWMDRQWQQQAENSDLIGAKWNWLWMDINLDNGDVISLWDMNSVTRDYNYAWATVMHPDGTQCVCRMELVQDIASEYWRSPVSNQNYPTRFAITIPDIDTKLDVRAVVKESEIVSQIPFLNKYEGACTLEGTYRGQPMGGYCYVEMLGDWTDEH